MTPEFSWSKNHYAFRRQLMVKIKERLDVLNKEQMSQSDLQWELDKFVRELCLSSGASQRTIRQLLALQGAFFENALEVRS